MATDFKAIVIDLDGTLMGPEAKVSDQTRRAVFRALEAGLEIIIATGRTASESAAALKAVEHQGLVISAGGALLTDSAGRTLDRIVLQPEQVELIANLLIPAQHKVLLLKDASRTGYDYLAVGDATLDPVTEWWFDHLAMSCQYRRRLDDDPHPEHSIRAGAVSAHQTLAEVAEILCREYSDQLEILFWPAVTPEGDQQANRKKIGRVQLLEVFAKGVSKWVMLERIMLSRSWDASQVAAIGDGLNDIDLLKNVGMGIAMGNADEHVKDAADHVTNDHRHDGVAQAIDQILAGKLTSGSA